MNCRQYNESSNCLSDEHRRACWARLICGRYFSFLKLEKKSRGFVPWQSTKVAPLSKAAYPSALQMLRVSQCVWKSSSLYAQIPNDRMIPAPWTLKYEDTARHIGNSNHLSRRATCWVIFPEGMGLHGLLMTSSSGQTLWLETQNWSKWSHTQTNVCMNWRGSTVGRARVANAVYRNERNGILLGMDGYQVQEISYNRYENGFDIWMSEEV